MAAAFIAAGHFSVDARAAQRPAFARCSSFAHPLPLSVPRRPRTLLPQPCVQRPSCASTSPAPPVKPRSVRISDAVYRVSNVITNLFPVWTVLASVVALQWPALFATSITPRMVTLSLSALMLSTGLTLTLSELRYAFHKPLSLMFAFVACYAIMPALAVLLARLFSLERSLAGGLILLGIISGGQASNLCTSIAGGDTALSVAMTTLTTVTAVAMLPLLSELLLGTVIELNSAALARSTAQIVLLPILLGAVTNKVAGGLVARVKPVLLVLGIAMVVVLILGPVAKTATLIQGSFGSLMLPVVLLHVLGGVVGYVVPVLFGAREGVAITTGFETGFKSPALSFVLASAHFQAVGMRVPSAISIIVLAPVAALFAVVLKLRGGGGATRRRAGSGVMGRLMRRGKAKVDADESSKVGSSARAMTRRTRFRLELADGRCVTVRYERLGVELRRARRGRRRLLTVAAEAEVDGEVDGEMDGEVDGEAE